MFTLDNLEFFKYLLKYITPYYNTSIIKSNKIRFAEQISTMKRLEIRTKFLVRLPDGKIPLGTLMIK